MIILVAVNKSEKQAISAALPKTQFARTMKQDSKRHHYYMVEEPGAMKMLRELRYADEFHGSGKRKGRNAHGR